MLTNPNEILDDVLKFIYVYQNNGLTINPAESITKFVLEKCFTQYNKEVLSAYNDSLIYSSVGKDRTIGETEFKEVLEKLAEDGYLRKDEYPYGHEWRKDSYYTTFKGRWFIKFGGYVLEHEEKEHSRKRQASLEEHQIVLQKTQTKTTELQMEILKKQTDSMIEQTLIQSSMRNLNYWIALGTIIAAIYYFTEMKGSFPIGGISFAVFSLGIVCLVGFISSTIVISRVRRRKKKLRENNFPIIDR